ncbi:MAG: hypothetical protein ACI8P3_002685 [Saprospiraceae bacterium]|jgi:hypothetical protein
MLESYPIRIEDLETEIIPFTDLLDMIVDRLMKKVA